jgi:hypothetical protein
VFTRRKANVQKVCEIFHKLPLMRFLASFGIIWKNCFGDIKHLLQSSSIRLFATLSSVGFSGKQTIPRCPASFLPHRITGFLQLLNLPFANAADPMLDVALIPRR